VTAPPGGTGKPGGSRTWRGDSWIKNEEFDRVVGKNKKDPGAEAPHFSHACRALPGLAAPLLA